MDDDSLPLLAQQKPRGHWSALLVWLVPALALVIALGIAIDSMLAAGPVITIRFRSADGIEAGKTRIKYKEVDIGEVKSLAFSSDRKEVIASARIDAAAADFLRQDTRFWVVTPRIGAGGVSGLGTLLSGAYIGIDVGQAAARRSDFTVLDKPPVLTDGRPGKRFLLHAPDSAALAVGSPVTLRKLTVGEVVAIDLDPDGAGVSISVFVDAPYDRYVSRGSAFWNASGVDLSLDADGLKLRSDSLISLLAGGIAFESGGSAPGRADAAPADSAFTLFVSRESAMQHPDTSVRTVLMYFDESVRGLKPGAPVDFRGIVVGEVKAVSLEYEPKKGIYRFPVEVNIYRERLSEHYRSGAARARTADDDGRAVLDRLIANGMRAQLRTGSLVTGMLYIGLDFVDGAAPAKLDWSHLPVALPTVPSSLLVLEKRLQGIAGKIDALPLQQLSGDLRRDLASLDQALKGVDALAKNIDARIVPEAAATLGQARKAIASADGMIASGSPLRNELEDSLVEVRRAASALRALADTLDRHPEALLHGNPPDRK
jgi:paraquat-inducible protein B